MILVYAGLAILNPSAKAQVRQYSLSVAALFKLMIQEKEEEFVSRIRAVREKSIFFIRPVDIVFVPVSTSWHYNPAKL